MFNFILITPRLVLSQAQYKYKFTAESKLKLVKTNIASGPALLWSGLCAALVRTVNIISVIWVCD